MATSALSKHTKRVFGASDQRSSICRDVMKYMNQISTCLHQPAAIKLPRSADARSFVGGSFKESGCNTSDAFSIQAISQWNKLITSTAANLQRAVYAFVYICFRLSYPADIYRRNNGSSCRFALNAANRHAAAAVSGGVSLSTRPPLWPHTDVDFSSNVQQMVIQALSYAGQQLFVNLINSFIYVIICRLLQCNSYAKIS